jgi:hypothetical protein
MCFSGMDLAKNYTAVLPSLAKEKQDPLVDEGRAVYLIIKIYEKGALTPYIDTLKSGRLSLSVISSTHIVYM